MGEDLSDLQRLEQQIIHAEKLATLGQLAAGVLHELNNPLTSITVYSDYLLQKARRSGGDASDAEKLARISDAAARMTRFTRDLVTYARPSSDIKASVSMLDVLEQSLGFCEHVLDEGGVLVERNYGHDLPRIEAAQGQLHQVFVNLITNACQAMSTARDEAKSTRTAKLLVHAERVNTELVVKVSDTGPGIAAENVAKIFEPFFTTKREGKGTGLGLSIVRNLVVHNGGAITAHSQPDVGTTFELRFQIR
jgi:C4-dicarboxylate-specific signal transduction histidine kinase